MTEGEGNIGHNSGARPKRKSRTDDQVIVNAKREAADVTTDRALAEAHTA